MHDFLETDLVGHEAPQKVLLSMTCKSAYLTNLFLPFFAGMKKSTIQLTILHKNLEMASNFSSPITTVPIRQFHPLKTVR